MARELPQDNDLRDDALAALDNINYRLMGAFDVLARVAHRVAGIASKERDAGWQKPEWLKELSHAAPQLADLMRPGTCGAHVLTIVRLLRNTIHGEALRGVGFHAIGKPARSLVAVNRAEEASLATAMDALGGRARFGHEAISPEHAYVDPAQLVEALLEEVLPLLNELMGKTPVELLKGVALSADDLGAPTAPLPDNLFAEGVRFSLRKQYGF